MKAWLRVYDKHGDNLTRPKLVEARRRADGRYCFDSGYARFATPPSGEAPAPVSGIMLVQKKTGRPIVKRTLVPSREITEPTMYIGYLWYDPSSGT